MTKPKLVVVDVETTGFSRQDRIVEIAALTLDPDTWEIRDEFDTLINPQRDMGPIGVHGIGAAMVEAAPEFSDILPTLADRLHGAVLVAHNLAFDARMLRQDFARAAVAIDTGGGLCTYRATKQKLSQACSAFDIQLVQQHRALADARATAELARRIRSRLEMQIMGPMNIPTITRGRAHHTLRRELADAGTSPMHRMVMRAAVPDRGTAVQQYLDMLDWVLDDGVIDQQERSDMRALARDLGISEQEQREAHRAYLECIIEAATRDTVFSAAERALILRMADHLSVDDVEIPTATPLASADSITQGSRVCFTGGTAGTKEILGDIAQLAGLQVVQNVTKKGCDVLVAADKATASGKAKNARKWDIPILSKEAFIQKFIKH